MKHRSLCRVEALFILNKMGKKENYFLNEKKMF